jgi:hypothetical protein
MWFAVYFVPQVREGDLQEPIRLPSIILFDLCSMLQLHSYVVYKKWCNSGAQSDAVCSSSWSHVTYVTMNCRTVLNQVDFCLEGEHCEVLLCGRARTANVVSYAYPSSGCNWGKGEIVAPSCGSGALYSSPRKHIAWGSLASWIILWCCL